MLSHRITAARIVLSALTLFVALVLPGPALASVNLPLHHWAYEAIERLTAMGVIDRAMLGPKPYSRKEAAMYVARTVERIRANQLDVDSRERVAEPLLDRLMQEFRPELTDLGTLSRPKGETSSLVRYGGIARTEGDAFSVGGGQTVRFRENRGGEYYANGIQNQTDIRGWVEVGDWLAVQAQPKFISNHHVLGIGVTDNSQNFYMREFSLKATYYNVALEAGRGTQWWGHGYHGSLLLTDHPFPLDMIKLGSDKPFRLPGFLEGLGDWKMSTFLAQLENNRDFPDVKLFGLRVSYMPADWLELGGTRLTMFGGKGRDQPFPKTVLENFFNRANRTGNNDVNEQSMLDFRARIPRVPYLVPFPGGMQIYGELGSEDKWSQIPIPSRAAYLGGVYIPQLFGNDSQDLRIEYADTDYTRRKTGFKGVWYNNGQFPSGMRYRGFPIGHHMGTDATDFFIRTTRYVGERWQVGTNFNIQERARGQPIHESKREWAIDLTWWASAKTQVQVGYTHQYLKNPGQITAINPYIETFAAGVTAQNHLLWTSLAIEF